MFLIHCPYCAEHREEDEFHAAGQAHLPRPLDPDSMSDEAWAQYLYFRQNPRGEHRELWVHAAGCRKYFNVLRNTQTYEIYGTYKAGEWLELDEAKADASSSSTLNYRHTGASNAPQAADADKPTVVASASDSSARDSSDKDSAS